MTTRIKKLTRFQLWDRVLAILTKYARSYNAERSPRQMEVCVVKEERGEWLRVVHGRDRDTSFYFDWEPGQINVIQWRKGLEHDLQRTNEQIVLDGSASDLAVQICREVERRIPASSWVDEEDWR